MQAEYGCQGIFGERRLCEFLQISGGSGFQVLKAGHKLDFLSRARILQVRMTAWNNLVIGPWLVCLQKQPHVNVLPLLVALPLTGHQAPN